MTCNVHHHDAMQPRQKSNVLQPGHVTFSLQFHAKILSTHWLRPTSEAQSPAAPTSTSSHVCTGSIYLFSQYRAVDCLLTSSSVTYSLSECTSLMYYFDGRLWKVGCQYSVRNCVFLSIVATENYAAIACLVWVEVRYLIVVLLNELIELMF